MPEMVPETVTAMGPATPYIYKGTSTATAESRGLGSETRERIGASPSCRDAPIRAFFHWEIGRAVLELSSRKASEREGCFKSSRRLGPCGT